MGFSDTPEHRKELENMSQEKWDSLTDEMRYRRVLLAEKLKDKKYLHKINYDSKDIRKKISDKGISTKMSRKETKTKIDQELRSYIKSYQNKVDENHSRESSELENKISLLEERITILENDNNKGNKKISELQYEITIHGEKILKQDDEISSHGKKIIRLQNENKVIKEENKVIRKENEIIKEKNKKLYDMLIEYQNNILQTTLSLDTMKSSFERMIVNIPNALSQNSANENEKIPRLDVKKKQIEIPEEDE